MLVKRTYVADEKGVAGLKVGKRIKIPRRGEGFDMSHTHKVFLFLVRVKNSPTLGPGSMPLDIRSGGGRWGADASTFK